MAYLGYAPELGQTASANISGHIGTLLQGLAQNKANNMAIKNKENTLIQGGFNPDFAKYLATQPDEMINNVIKQTEGFGTSGLYQQPMQQQVMQPQQQNDVSGIIQQVYQQHPELQGQVSPEELGQYLQMQQGQNQQQGLGGIRPKGSSAEFKKQQFEQNKKFEKSQSESKEYLKKLNTEVKGAKDENIRLKRMQELIKSGKLAKPATAGLLKTIAEGIGGYGIDLRGAFFSPESQEFEKLSQDFLKSLKDVFGSGRITNLEVSNYLKTIPNLLQSNDGKEAVIHNLQLFNEGKLIKQKVARDIINSNNGIIPADLELLVDEYSQPQLDKLAEEFKKGIPKKAPKKKPEYSFTPFGIKFKDL